MEIGKIKNFILIVLVLANIALLGIFGLEKNREMEIERLAYTQLQMIYDEAGISLPTSLKVMEKAPQGHRLTRNLEDEKAMIEKLLGKCTAVEQGGSIYIYSGPNGQANLRGTGEFDMLLGHGVIDGSKGKEAAAREFMKKLGLECGEYVDVEVDEEQTKVTLDCMFEGSEVYNARVSCRFSGDNLLIVNGKRVFDRDTDHEFAETIDAGTALVRFLKESKEKGYVCSSVEDISAGYTMSVSVLGECVLTPVWYIETDAGSHLMNAETGKLETVSY